MFDMVEVLIQPYVSGAKLHDNGSLFARQRLGKLHPFLRRDRLIYPTHMATAWRGLPAVGPAPLDFSLRLLA